MKINFSVRSLLVFFAICFTTLPVLLFGLYQARTGADVLPRTWQAVWSAVLVALFCGVLGAGAASLASPRFKSLLARTTRRAEFDAISRIADTILIARSDGRITYVNDAGIRMFGEALGRHLQDLIGADTAARVLSREQLLDLSRLHNAEVYDRSIDVQILRLRRKIETNPSQPAYIKTERGIGYLFDTPVEVLY